MQPIDSEATACVLNCGECPGATKRRGRRSHTGPIFPPLHYFVQGKSIRPRLQASHSPRPPHVANGAITALMTRYLDHCSRIRNATHSWAHSSTFILRQSAAERSRVVFIAYWQTIPTPGLLSRFPNSDDTLSRSLQPHPKCYPFMDALFDIHSQAECRRAIALGLHCLLAENPHTWAPK